MNANDEMRCNVGVNALLLEKIKISSLHFLKEVEYLMYLVLVSVQSGSNE